MIAISSPNKRTSGVLCVTVAVVALTHVGCMRQQFRQRADEDAYGLIGQKTVATPWQPPYDYTIETDPRSRLFDPTNPDYPSLPLPGPHLYSYELPQLRSDSDRSTDDAEELPSPSPRTEPHEPPEPQEFGQLLNRAGDHQKSIIATSFNDDVPPAELNDEQRRRRLDGYSNGIAALPVQPVAARYWDALPPQCLERMFEFATVRDEYDREFKQTPPNNLRDDSRKLSLEDIVEVALLDSRQYQTQKELLYRAALDLSLRRFDYLTKFTFGGNGADVNYTHARVGGVTTNTLAVPSSLEADKLLATGGTMLARFANDVILTFNGANGFTADVSSQLLFNISQTVLQRDVVLNPLIQAERNLVYAARDFERFRRVFFFDLANEYYSLLLTYRDIEINAQNYFSFVRSYEQGRAERRAGFQSQTQVDQFEQQMLAARSQLISTCNALEGQLDALKLTLGLPTETPINLRLKELTQLTLRDEIEVAAEQVRRWRERLETERAEPEPGRAALVTAAVFLLERLQEWFRLRSRIEEPHDTRQLEELLRQLRVDKARIDLSRDRVQLLAIAGGDRPPPAVLLYMRLADVIETSLNLVARQLDWADQLGKDRDKLQGFDDELQKHAAQAEDIRKRVLKAVQDGDNDQIKEIVTETEGFLTGVEGLVTRIDEVLGVPAKKPEAEEQLQKTIEITDDLLAKSAEFLEAAKLGLVPVEISVDEAMCTALVQRLDLMNERGFLADDWRSIKLAADDLKSILNLNASQTIRTENNRPFDFTWDESTTQLSLSFDAPLNRRAQRNGYRQTLINYQAGRRNLMATEDDIKFDVRGGLRSLELGQVRYLIDVASAALAAERVTSTRLQLALGTSGVQARDLIEALQDRQVAVGDVAETRIQYILDRARLALDLELITLDDRGFWPEITNDGYQPQPNFLYPPNAGPTYGTFPRFLKVSRDIKRMFNSPPPHGCTHGPADALFPCEHCSQTP